MRNLLTVVCVLAILGAGIVGFAEGDSSSSDAHYFFTDKLQISAGAIFPNFNTDVKLDGDNGREGTTVDFEKLFGLEDELASAFAHLMWRINDKHRLEFMYYNIDRDGTRNLGKNINFGDQTFTFGTDMTSSLDMSVYRLGYDYSFVNDGEKEFGIGVSADIVPVDFSVQATGGVAETEDAVLIVPTFGIHAAYRLTEKLVAAGKLQGFVYDVDNQDGSVINGLLGFEYDAFEHFSVGLTYAYYDFDVDLDTGGFNGSIAFVYRGPLVYGKLHF
ncbi:MAG: hypothetical protein ABH954_05430 [Candidatus Omnitrophota bacterium]